ncbi:MAG: hypothetical protein IJN39_01465 [Clostridia bacterium]|nr:hypothetical protein [Clostridia bacterium]
MEEKLIGWDDDGIFLIVEISDKGKTKTVSITPDFEYMTKEELIEYNERVTEKIRDMNENEPKRKSGDKYDSWLDLHEDLEDIRDEVLEFIDKK